MLYQKIIYLKNLILLRAIAYILVLSLLYTINLQILNNLSILTNTLDGKDIGIKNMTLRINILEHEKEKIIQTDSLFKDLVQNQFLEICNNKFTVLNEVNNLSKNSNFLIKPIYINISQDLWDFNYQTFNNCNLINIDSAIAFATKDLNSAMSILQNIIDIIPRKTAILSLEINNYGINSYNLSEIIKAKQDSFFQISAKIENNKVLAE
jgi:hypothetical protein